MKECLITKTPGNPDGIRVAMQSYGSAGFIQCSDRDFESENDAEQYIKDCIGDFELWRGFHIMNAQNVRQVAYTISGEHPGEASATRAELAAQFNVTPEQIIITLFAKSI